MKNIFKIHKIKSKRITIAINNLYNNIYYQHCYNFVIIFLNSLEISFAYARSSFNIYVCKDYTFLIIPETYGTLEVTKFSQKYFSF
jgi:hypothetical protein